MFLKEEAIKKIKGLSSSILIVLVGLILGYMGVSLMEFFKVLCIISVICGAILFILGFFFIIKFAMINTIVSDENSSISD